MSSSGVTDSRRRCQQIERRPTGPVVGRPARQSECQLHLAHACDPEAQSQRFSGCTPKSLGQGQQRARSGTNSRRAPQNSDRLRFLVLRRSCRRRQCAAPKAQARLSAPCRAKARISPHAGSSSPCAALRTPAPSKPPHATTAPGDRPVIPIASCVVMNPRSQPSGRSIFSSR